MAHSLRAVQEGDGEFLFSVYAGTRDVELSRVPWLNEQKEEFLRMQYTAQSTYYAQIYPQMEYSIVVHDGADAGRLIVAELSDEYRIVDISLLPAHRRAGIGTALITDVFGRARAAHKAVRIHVEAFNPAKALYERLGFREHVSSEIYIQMEWKPQDELKLNEHIH